MKKLYISVLFVTIGLISLAQQDPQFSHNMFNQMDVNPGYAGSNDAICATLLHRSQWIGFKDLDGNKGAPVTTLMSVDAAINPINSGLGLTIMQDKLGFESNLNVKIAYAYRLRLFSGTLGIGVQVAFMNKAIDFSKFKYLDMGDPILGNLEQKTMFTDFAFGAYYSIPNKLYFGIAIPQLAENVKQFADGSRVTNYTLKRHYYINGGYHYQLNNPDLVLNPSLFIKTDLVSAQFDLNALVWFKQTFWGGLSYRATDAIVFLAGLRPFANSTSKMLQPLKFGIGYDFTTSALGRNGRSYGCAEVMLTYCFKIVVEKIPQSYKNVRFL